jgi:NAD-dependent SIR2 family protein deacetylase
MSVGHNSPKLDRTGHMRRLPSLHQAAGSRAVVDLHGRLDRVVCLRCEASETRASVHQRLSEANPGLVVDSDTINPDGDVDLDDSILASFTMVPCLACGGDLKPDVVYFGESVPVDRVQQAYEWVDRARSILVVGSSLTVYSGRRFVIRAHNTDKPVAIVNAGPTRGDEFASLRIDDDVCEVLRALVG